MTERLYLVRRRFEKFLGPFSFKELKHAYKNLEIDTQDEVSAGGRDWVYLYDSDQVHHTYPEILHFLKDDTNGHWQTPKVGSHSQRQAAPQRRWLWVAAGLSLVVAGLVGYKYKDEWLRLYAKSPMLEKAEALSEKKKWQALQQFFWVNRAKLPKWLAAKAEYRKDWLPLIREAFYRSKGEIRGISPQWISLDAKKTALVGNCSVQAWKEDLLKDRFRWRMIASGRNPPTGNLSKILLWDSHWLRRRTPEDGWHKPQSSYDYCVTLALVAIGELMSNYPISGRNLGHLRRFQERLLLIQDLVRREKPKVNLVLSGPLSKLNCYEVAQSLRNLADCDRLSLPDLSPAWRRVMNERWAVNGLRVLFKDTNPLMSRVQRRTMFDSFMAKIDVNQPAAPGMNYQAEVKGFRRLLRR